LAFGSFAKLANATANLGKIEAHLGSILAASMMCFIAAAKLSNGVAIEHDVMVFMVLRSVEC
jgi:hypothetical protein